MRDYPTPPHVLYTFHSLSLPTQSFRTRWGHWGERTWSRTRKKGTERKSEETAFKREKSAVRIKARQNLIAKNYQRHKLARPQKGSSLLSWLHTSSSIAEPSSHRSYFSPAVQASCPPCLGFPRTTSSKAAIASDPKKTAWKGRERVRLEAPPRQKSYHKICIASAFFKHMPFSRCSWLIQTNNRSS